MFKQTLGCFLVAAAGFEPTTFGLWALQCMYHWGSPSVTERIKSAFLFLPHEESTIVFLFGWCTRWCTNQIWKSILKVVWLTDRNIIIIYFLQVCINIIPHNTIFVNSWCSAFNINFFFFFFAEAFFIVWHFHKRQNYSLLFQWLDICPDWRKIRR